MFYRIYRFLGSTSGLFNEVTGSEVADCEVTVCDRRAFEGAVREGADWEVTIEGTVCVKGIMWKRIFNLRSTHDVDMTILCLINWGICEKCGYDFSNNFIVSIH